MTPEQIAMLLTSLWPWGFVKIFLLTLLLFYAVFAAICLRQIDLMNQMVEAQISPALRMVAIIHLGAAVFVFLLTLFVL